MGFNSWPPLARALTMVGAGSIVIMLCCCGLASCGDEDDTTPSNPTPTVRTTGTVNTEPYGGPTATPSTTYSPLYVDRSTTAPPPATTAPWTPEVGTDDPDDDEGGAYYANCAAVRAAGKAPLRHGQPGYRAGLDRDGDGKACD